MKGKPSFSRNRASYQLLSLASGMAIALAGAPGAAFAQTRGASPQKAAAVTSAAKPARAQSGGQKEGISVHGEWTIIIRNADGSIAARHQFKNALVQPALMSRILARGGSPGMWAIFLNQDTQLSPSPPTLCPTFPTTFFTLTGCWITETPGSSTPIPSISPNLVVSAPSFGAPDFGSFFATGSIRVSFAGQLTVVQAGMATCVPSQAPAITCTTLPGGPVGGLDILTHKDISSLNITVQAGQTVDVTVKISFS